MLYFSEASRMKYIFKSFDDASARVDTPVLTNISLDTSIPSEKDLEEIKQLNVIDEEKEQCWQ